MCFYPKTALDVYPTPVRLLASHFIIRVSPFIFVVRCILWSKPISFTKMQNFLSKNHCLLAKWQLTEEHIYNLNGQLVGGGSIVQNPGCSSV